MTTPVFWRGGLLRISRLALVGCRYLRRTPRILTRMVYFTLIRPVMFRPGMATPGLARRWEMGLRLISTARLAVTQVLSVVSGRAFGYWGATMFGRGQAGRAVN